MKILGFAFLFALVSFNASSQTKDNQAAISFNNKMIDMLKGLNDNGKAWVENYTTIRNNSKNFSELAEERKQLENYIDTSLKILRELQNVGGSEELHEAVTQFFEMEKKLVAETFVPFEKLNKNSTIAETEKLWSKLSGEATKKETEGFARIKELQKEYAERNDFATQ